MIGLSLIFHQRSAFIRKMLRLNNRSKYFFRQSFLFRILLSLTVIILMLMVVMSIWSFDSITNAKKCFRHKNSVESEAAHTIEFLEDVMAAETRPQNGKNIFFHETSCLDDHLVRLNARQACAIESAAKANPNWNVFALFASPAGFINDSMPHAPIIQALESYSNIYMRNVHLWTYATGTPFENWLNKGDLFYSQYLNSHASDFLRYLSMYKFGGIYMDLDVVVQKSFENIEPNFSGAESSEDIAAGVMSFDQNGIGHEVATRCVGDFIQNFNGNDWGNNGPGVITRVLHQICNTKNSVHMSREQCNGFKAYPPNEFYAVPWREWHKFFDPKYTNETLQKTKDSLVVHVWNKKSIETRVKVGSNVAYGIVAARHCPKVYQSCGEYF